MLDPKILKIPKYCMQNKVYSLKKSTPVCVYYIYIFTILIEFIIFIVPLTSCRWKVGKRLKNTTKTNTIKKEPTEWTEISPLAVFRDQNIVDTFFWHWSNDVYGSVEPVFHRPRHVYSYKSRGMTWQNGHAPWKRREGRGWWKYVLVRRLCDLFCARLHHGCFFF